MNFKNSFFKLSLKAVAVIFFINAFAIIDSNIRTFEYKERADQYASWHRNPAEKELHFEKEKLKRKKVVDKLFKAKKINKEKYDLELENNFFLKEFKIKESSAKYSYFWNKKAANTFGGPFILGKQNLSAEALSSKKTWVMELEKKKIKFKDYMVD
ncbi:MAG: hypothetical protein KKD35_04310 [Elusimicrobia bacterium]|nr:hypothetical protein [Elusimicrobiota bacterium]